MAMTEKMLAQGRYNDTSNNLMYTVPASTRTGISAVHMCNTTASAVTVRVFFVPSGGSADQSSAMLYDFTIAPNDYHSLSPERPHFLDTGDMVYVQNGTANGVTFTVSGVEIS